MELPNNNEQLEGIGTALGNAQSLSLLKRAQQKRQARERTLFLDVPSWNGDLICEYRVVPPDDLKKVAEKALRRARSNNGSQAATNDIDLIIAASVGLYMKDPETGDRVAIEDQFGHVSYDRIAKLLGVDDEIDTAVDTVRYLMGERDKNGDGWVENVVAMSLHSNAISNWMKDPSKQVVDLEALLGEI